MVNGSPRPRSEADHRTVETRDPPEQPRGARPSERVAKHRVEPARVRLLKRLADRLRRAAMPPAGVSEEKKQRHPCCQYPSGSRRRRDACGKRLSHLGSRPRIDQHHEFIVTAHRSAVVSPEDRSDCLPGRLRAARPTSSGVGASRSHPANTTGKRPAYGGHEQNVPAFRGTARPSAVHWRLTSPYGYAGPPDSPAGSTRSLSGCAARPAQKGPEADDSEHPGHAGLIARSQIPAVTSRARRGLAAEGEAA